MRLRHTPYLFLAALATILSIPVGLHAQANETVLDIPPALTASNGRALIGTQSGKIYRAVTGITGKLTFDTTAVLEIPSDVRAVWTLTVPNPKTTPDLVVGLVSYATTADSAAPTEYGILRSTDFGASWTLLKPAAFISSALVDSNDWVTQSLGEIIWLEDGMHGWAYGRHGIVRTTDAGLTWELMRAVNTPEANIWALEFKSPTQGSAVIGLRSEQNFHTTTDGGRTWTLSTATTLRPFRVVRIDYIGEEYRALVMDRFQVLNNSYMYYSPDGVSWTSRKLASITREQTNMSEVFWADSSVGFMVLRSGDIYRSTNAGRVWFNVQVADSVDYPVNPRTGWGQRSILLDNSSIVHVSTTNRKGAVSRFEQWLVQLSAVPDDSRRAAAPVLSIVPNPAAGPAILQVELPRPASLRIRVVDPLGRSLLHHDIPAAAAGTVRFGLDLSSLSAGAYRVVVEGEGITTSSSLLVVE